MRMEPSSYEFRYGVSARLGLFRSVFICVHLWF